MLRLFRGSRGLLHCFKYSLWVTLIKNGLLLIKNGLLLIKNETCMNKKHENFLRGL